MAYEMGTVVFKPLFINNYYNINRDELRKVGAVV